MKSVKVLDEVFMPIVWNDVYVAFEAPSTVIMGSFRQRVSIENIEYLYEQEKLAGKKFLEKEIGIIDPETEEELKEYCLSNEVEVDEEESDKIFSEFIAWKNRK